LSWATTTGLMPKTNLPRRRTSNPAPMAQRNRLAMIRKLLESPEIPLRERVVGLLVLFYAQPVSRIADTRSRAPSQPASRPAHPTRVIPRPQRRHRLVVPRPSSRPTHAVTSTRRSPARARDRPPSRPNLCPPPTRAAGPSTSHRKHARLPQHAHRLAPSRSRRHLESLRTR
jgi:hypothetical protein